LVVEFLEPVKAVPAVAHHLAGLADVAELLGKLQQSNLGADNLLFGRHGVLQIAEAGRFATKQQLVSEIAAWERQRNASVARIKWMFTTEKARAKMGRAYPAPAGATKES
jgi:hypothetical protein